MADIIIYIILAFALGMSVILRMSSRRLSRIRKVNASEAGDAVHDGGCDPETRTRILIGDDVYAEMSRRVDELLESHISDQCVTVQLTAGSECAEASKRLHALLPGDRLTLCRNVEEGVAMIDVYSDGYRIGRLLLGDAETVFDVMRESHITGVYVAEQNCYGDCPYVAMKIIVFHSPALAREWEIRNERDSSVSTYKITFSIGDESLEVYQN